MERFELWLSTRDANRMGWVLGVRRPGGEEDIAEVFIADGIIPNSHRHKKLPDVERAESFARLYAAAHKIAIKANPDMKDAHFVALEAARSAQS